MRFAGESGAARFDVGEGEAYAGSITPLLPAGLVIVDVFDEGKVFRLEVRPGTPAREQRWITVIDAAATPAEAARATPLTAAGHGDGRGALDGEVDDRARARVLAGGAIGVLLESRPARAKSCSRARGAREIGSGPGQAKRPSPLAWRRA